MSNLHLVSARLAGDPVTGAMYEYVVAGNGLFVHAEDSRMEACIPIAPARCSGLAELEPFARLKLDRIPEYYLVAVLEHARRHLPNEVAYQFVADKPAPWRCICPAQKSGPGAVVYADEATAVVDLHSHGDIAAFFSNTDDKDEGGLRFYAVIGNISHRPTLRVRVGVYGHHWEISPAVVFYGLGPFEGGICEAESH